MVSANEKRWHIIRKEGVKWARSRVNKKMPGKDVENVNKRGGRMFKDES